MGTIHIPSKVNFESLWSAQKGDLGASPSASPRVANNKNSVQHAGSEHKQGPTAFTLYYQSPIVSNYSGSHLQSVALSPRTAEQIDSPFVATSHGAIRPKNRRTSSSKGEISTKHGLRNERPVHIDHKKSQLEQETIRHPVEFMVPKSNKREKRVHIDHKNSQLEQETIRHPVEFMVPKSQMKNEKPVHIDHKNSHLEQETTRHPVEYMAPKSNSKGKPGPP